jgi:hypothetical protein
MRPKIAQSGRMLTKVGDLELRSVLETAQDEFAKSANRAAAQRETQRSQ